MIALTCLHCDKNLKVKDELAGKKVRCPQCKQALEVPVPSSEDATVAPNGAHPVKEDATIAPSWSPPTDVEPAHAIRGDREPTATMRRRRSIWPLRPTTRWPARLPAAAWGRSCAPSIATFAARSPSSTCSTTPTTGKRPASSRRRRSPGSSNIPTSCRSTNSASMKKAVRSSR